MTGTVMAALSSDFQKNKNDKYKKKYCKKKIWVYYYICLKNYKIYKYIWF